MNQSIISKKDIAAVRQLFPEHHYLTWDFDGVAWVFKFKPIYSKADEMWVTSDPLCNEDSRVLGDAMYSLLSGENAKLWIVDLKTAEMLFQAKSYLTPEEKRSLRLLFPWAKYAEHVMDDCLWLYSEKPLISENGLLSANGCRFEVLEGIELKNWPEGKGHCECLLEDA